MRSTVSLHAFVIRYSQRSCSFRVQCAARSRLTLPCMIRRLGCPKNLDRTEKHIFSPLWQDCGLSQLTGADPFGREVLVTNFRFLILWSQRVRTDSCNSIVLADRVSGTSAVFFIDLLHVWYSTVRTVRRDLRVSCVLLQRPCWSESCEVYVGGQCWRVY